MFVAGPAMETSPMSFSREGPEIITAPGEMSLKGVGRIMSSRVIAVPQRVRRNSAHMPRLWAVNLCAISWMKNEAARMTVKASKPMVRLGMVKPIKLSDNPTPITMRVAATRCLSSFGLK